MTDKEKIRAEIERIQETHERNLDKPMERGRIGYAHGCVDCCDRLLAFIDSLPEEPSCPKESDDLDKLVKEVQKYYSDNFDYITSDQPTLSILTNIARYFTEWQKRKMMEGAVEGEITKDIHNLLHVKSGPLPMPSEFKFGDKVEIVILKGDKQNGKVY